MLASLTQSLCCHLNHPTTYLSIYMGSLLRSDRPQHRYALASAYLYLHSICAVLR
jgi:hypothetical protein